jgi:hypothetical protein
VSQPKPLARLLPAITRSVLKNKHPGLATLILEWESVMGGEWAGRTQPLKFVREHGKDQPATLVVSVDSAYALLAQHQEAQMVERANVALGHGAIGRIRWVQRLPPASAGA